MKPDFSKYPDDLMPAIVQDETTMQVLMLGYMNEKALQQTRDTKLVTFYSRSRQEIWVKGKSSGNYLYLKGILIDCDNDCLLVKATPAGPVCHTGMFTCFGSQITSAPVFLRSLEETIVNRKDEPSIGSYTSRLFAEGVPRIAQKVGEEAVELVIEAMQQNDDKFIGEAADLVYHLIVLLQSKGRSLNDVADELEKRAKS